MSTRQIRRLRRVLEEETPVPEESVPSSSPVVIQNRRVSSFARFREVLESSEDSDTESESGDSSESEEEAAKEKETVSSPPGNVSKPPKNRNKKASKGKVEQEAHSSESDSDFDTLLAESRKEHQASCEDLDHSTKRDFEFLKVDRRAFRVTVLPSDTDVKHRIKKGFGGREHSRHWLLPVSNPVVTNNPLGDMASQLKMVSRSDPNNGREYFVLEKSKRYTEIETICLEAVDMHNSDLLRQLYQANRYHIEVLLRVSYISTMLGQHEDSFVLLSLAIHLVQTCFPVRFSPFRINEQGYYNTWLPSSIRDNLVLYRLLLLYMVALERQAEWGVSLAICKLLLQMDFPDDKAHALLHIDMFLVNTAGLKMHQFSTGYARELRYPVPLHWVLPNFAFSMALDYFTKEDVAYIEAPYKEEHLDLLMRFLCLEEHETGLSLEIAAQDMESFSNLRAQLCLIRALIQYPSMLFLLAEQAFASELGIFLEKEPFCEWMVDCDCRESSELVKFYLAKSMDLWRNENLGFIRKTANIIVELYRTERGGILMRAYRELWLAFRLGHELPFPIENIIVSEFDLASYSLPMELQ